MLQAEAVRYLARAPVRERDGDAKDAEHRAHREKKRADAVGRGAGQVDGVKNLEPHHPACDERNRTQRGDSAQPAGGALGGEKAW